MYGHSILIYNVINCMHAYFFKLLTDVIGHVPAAARVPRPAPPPHLRLRTLRLQDQAGRPK